MTHIEKRYGLHEHRDGSPTDRSWGSGGGQDTGGSQGSGGGQPRAGTPAIESVPPERPQPPGVASPPVQNGGLRDGSLVPCALEGNPRASAEPMPGAGEKGSAQDWPVERQLDSQANWTPQITRYEGMGMAMVGSALIASYPGGRGRWH